MVHGLLTRMEHSAYQPTHREWLLVRRDYFSGNVERL